MQRTIPTVNVVVDAAEPSLSSGHMDAELRASRAASSVALFATETSAALKKMQTQLSKMHGASASFLAEKTSDGATLLSPALCVLLLSVYAAVSHGKVNIKLEFPRLSVPNAK